MPNVIRLLLARGEKSKHQVAKYFLTCRKESVSQTPLVPTFGKMKMSDAQPPYDPDSATYFDLIKLEVNVLQEIIARHERHSFTVLALLVAVISGLAFLAFSIKVEISAIEIWWMGGVAIVVFGFWALAHRVLCGRAIERQIIIEKNILEKSYTSIKASTWLRSLPCKTWIAALIYPTHVAPLVIAALVVWQLGELVKEKMPSRSMTSIATDHLENHFRESLTVESREVMMPHRKTVSMSVVSKVCIIELVRSGGAQWVPVGKMQCEQAVTSEHKNKEQISK